MATIMEMPKLSDTMKEGAISRWLKGVGDKVTAGLPIVEIETDKATMEFESPTSGILLKILVGDGGNCPLQAPIAVIGKSGENWEEALEAYTAKKNSKQQKGKPAPTPLAQPSTPVADQNLSKGSQSDRIKASPLAKKMAEELGVPLTQLSGSGPHGRIVARDVVATQKPGAAQIPQGPSSTSVPVSQMRKIIARRLVESVTQAPHFYLKISVDVGALLAWRQQTLLRLPNEKKFSVNDLMIFLVARALHKHPEVNSSWAGDHIVQYLNADVGVAVALPGGLVTPVVRNAHALSLFEIAQVTKQLIAQARAGKLLPDDYLGGTFTISNLGMSGIEEFTAIINPPQAAILAIGSTLPTPIVNHKGQIEVAQKMRLTLSCDHRVIDGAMGADFLKTLKLYLEDPMSALFQC